MTRALVATLLLMAAPAIADERLDGGQKHSGFALELNIGTRLLTIANTGTGGTNIDIGALQGGIFFGYKISRVIFGLGFDLSRVAQGSSTSGVANSDATSASTA